MAVELKTFEDLLVQQLEDLYDAEQQLTEALPEMAEAAADRDLKSAFKTHLSETKQQVKRLEKAFKHLGHEPQRETCEAMKGLIKEGKQLVKAKGEDSIRDAGLIAAAQRVEHYEMASYGSARAFAEQLGQQEIVQLLQETLEEEKATDKKLTDLAESQVNQKAG